MNVTPPPPPLPSPPLPSPYPPTPAPLHSPAGPAAHCPPCRSPPTPARRRRRRYSSRRRHRPPARQSPVRTCAYVCACVCVCVCVCVCAAWAQCGLGAVRRCARPHTAQQEGVTRHRIPPLPGATPSSAPSFLPRFPHHRAPCTLLCPVLYTERRKRLHPMSPPPYCRSRQLPRPDMLCPRPKPPPPAPHPSLLSLNPSASPLPPVLCDIHRRRRSPCCSTTPRPLPMNLIACIFSLCLCSADLAWLGLVWLVFAAPITPNGYPPSSCHSSPRSGSAPHCGASAPPPPPPPPHHLQPIHLHHHLHPPARP